MSREMGVRFSFEKRATVLEKNSEELKNYEEYFVKNILPDMREIEKRKTTARDKAY